MKIWVLVDTENASLRVVEKDWLVDSLLGYRESYAKEVYESWDMQELAEEFEQFNDFMFLSTLEV